MDNSKIIWPKISELDDVSEISLAPYGVLSQYSEAIFESYEKNLFGIVMARYKILANGDKNDFTYSLVISNTSKEIAQIKIIEMDVQDDGWYPAKVYAIKPHRETYGNAENELQLRKFLDAIIQSDFVKTQIKTLLK